MSTDIESKCKQKGVRLTDQRRLIAKIMSETSGHPDVDELHKRVNRLDSKISIATVYRTVKLFEEAGIVSKHDFKGNKSRYEKAPEEHGRKRSEKSPVFKLPEQPEARGRLMRLPALTE